MNINNQPAFYFPLDNGKYAVAAGLHCLTKDFGNGQIDQKIFQFDKTFSEYRQNKLKCRKECLSKYYQEDNFTPEAKNAISKFLIEHLCKEYPNNFVKTQHNNSIVLKCGLTGERLLFNHDYGLTSTENVHLKVPYTSTLDAIANQLQEDLAVVHLDNNNDYLCALHLCSPNHWAAEEKIGKHFIDIHSHVPHMEKLNQQSGNLLQALMSKGPYTRFAWGLATDNRLNHHPLAPEDIDEQHWPGRNFDINKPELWLRVERQTLSGLPDTNIILFTIRTYFYNVYDFRNQKMKLEQISSAISSMSSESLIYKGLQQSKNDILSWLQILKET